MTGVNVVAGILVGLGRDAPDTVKGIVEVEDDVADKDDDRSQDRGTKNVKRGIGVNLEHIGTEEREGDELKESLEEGGEASLALRDTGHAHGGEILE